ncbi:outer membrane biogenesis protein BamB [Symmachiella dynata]|uniref:Outer membrane biogenesis protein BamB n=1 Tax=Symmachiella dynata TaxID=2527995 RepID=A0A517ZYW8_9PLAN|nr:PQQ-binding-like beta-propeller repeat protein [Symmachiella dynata]QDU47666.1 outer membrane biogenesis protein BamB [Symmachiella dynata]
METEFAQVSGTSRTIAIIRLILAWIGTLSILPYTWGRTIVYWMSQGAPETSFLQLLIATIAGLAVLTYGVGSKFRHPRTKYVLLGCVVASWLAANVALIWTNSGTVISRFSLLPGFLPATLFVLWLGWIAFLPWSWPRRFFVTCATAVLLIPFLMIYRVAGLTGDGKVDFAFRTTAQRTFAADKKPQANDAVDPSEHTLNVAPGDFPQFLGPDRNGVITGVDLARDWEANPPQLLWRKPVGYGWSGFSIVGDYALTQEQRNERECVVCYDINTGDEIWVHSDDAFYDSTLGGPGPRGTPTVRDNRVYTWGATGVLDCLDGSTGEAIWSKNVLQEADANNLTYGISSSPLVTDTLVMIGLTGGEHPALVGYDRETGEQVFAAGEWKTSYSSPILVNVDGVPQVLNFTRNGLLSHDPETGQVLWQHKFGNDQGINASQPLMVPGRDDQIFLSSGYGVGSELITVKQTDGKWNITSEWTSRRMATKFTTAVIDGDHVYGLDNGIFACISLKTGKHVWKKGRYGHGQILQVGDLILVQTEKGPVVLVDPDPEKLIELGRIPALSSKTWNTLAYAHGKLLVRNDLEAVCYELPLAKSAE